MSLISNRDQILATSIWPTDKIVDVVKGSFVTDSAARVKDSFGSEVYAWKKVNHNFTRPVLCKLKWSLDNKTWVDGGLGQLLSDPLIYAIAWSDSSSVNIYTTLLSGTIYYEIVCIWIDDFDNTDPLVEPFTDTTKPFVFDSRVNYQKLYDQNPVSFMTTLQSKQVKHDLGYKPNCWVFFESNPGQVWPAIVGGADDVWLHNYSTQGEIDYQIDKTHLTLNWSAGASFSGTARAWYRIYVDD